MKKEELFEIIKNDITVVDFYADWCAPCKSQSVVINYAKKEYEKNNIKDVKFIKYDIDGDEDSITEVFNFDSIPTIFIFKNGKEYKRFTGLIGYDILDIMIKRIRKMD